MQQKTADELVPREGHGSLLTGIAIVLAAKGYLANVGRGQRLGSKVCRRRAIRHWLAV